MQKKKKNNKIKKIKTPTGNKSVETSEEDKEEINNMYKTCIEQLIYLIF